MMLDLDHQARDTPHPSQLELEPLLLQLPTLTEADLLQEDHTLVMDHHSDPLTPSEANTVSQTYETPL